MNSEENLGQGVPAADAEDAGALVLPQSGVVVNLSSDREVTLAYRDLRALKDKIGEAERVLKQALQQQASLRGTKTFYIDGVGKVELRGDQVVEYDPAQVEDGLRNLGCPEEIIREIVVETISYRVDGNRARRAASANPDYARVIENARRVVERLPSILIS